MPRGPGYATDHAARPGEDAVPHQEGAEDSQLTAWEDEEWVAHVLSALPPAQRQVMELIVKGLDRDEIAETLGPQLERAGTPGRPGDTSAARSANGRTTPATRSGHADGHPCHSAHQGCSGKLDAVAVLTARLLPAPQRTEASDVSVSRRHEHGDSR